MKDFDLKGYLKNNVLLNEQVEEQATEEVKEGYGKMKKSELKEKIREEILEAMREDDDREDDGIPDETSIEDMMAGTGNIGSFSEAEEDEIDADIDIDADVDMEEPAMDEPAEDDQFAGADELKDPSQIRDTAIPAWKEIGRAGEAGNDEALIKMATDGLRYTDKQYPDPTPFDGE